jgi:hypothetical protein
MKFTEDDFLSVVLIDDSSKSIDVYRIVLEYLSSEVKKFEVIICFGTKDMSDYQEKKAYLEVQENVACYLLASTNKEELLSYGLEVALGDWVLDNEISAETASYIDQLLKIARLFPSNVTFLIGSGNNSTLRDRFLSRLSVLILSYRISSFAPIARLMSRKSLRRWESMNLKNKLVRVAPFLSGTYGETTKLVGFCEINSKRLFRIGIRTLLYSSPKPLRIVSTLSFVAASWSMVTAVYVFIRGLATDVTPGWASTNLQMSLLSFITATSLGVISEYVYQGILGSQNLNGGLLLEENISLKYGYSENPNVKQIKGLDREIQNNE